MEWPAHLPIVGGRGVSWDLSKYRKGKIRASIGKCRIRASTGEGSR